MKTIVNILKHIFVPFSAFLFLILGILACFSSAVIEFYVLREFLSLPGSGIDENSWAALIVLVLEGSKFTLHFYAEALKKKDLATKIKEFDVERKRRTICMVKSALTVLSLVCSVICFTNIFYYNSADKLKEVIAARDERCEQILVRETEKLEEEREKAITQGKDSYQKELEDLNGMQERYDQTLEAVKNEIYIARRQDLQEEAEMILEEINTRSNSYNAHIEKVKENADKVYSQKKEALEEKYGVNGTERVVEDNELLAQTDNKYLSNFLMAFSKTLLGRPYSRGAYFLFSVMIGIVIAIILEMCINISQSLLSMGVESFLQIIGELPPLTYGKAIVKVTLSVLFSIMMCTAAYLISSIVLFNPVQQQNLPVALGAYGMAVVLFNVISIKKEGGIIENMTEKPNASNTLWYGILLACKDALVPAALSFVFYCLIGYVCNGSFSYGDMNGLAVAIGGAVANKTKMKNLEWSV